jgi:hypothetical protein
VPARGPAAVSPPSPASPSNRTSGSHDPARHSGTSRCRGAGCPAHPPGRPPAGRSRRRPRRRRTRCPSSQARRRSTRFTRSRASRSILIRSSGRASGGVPRHRHRSPSDSSRDVDGSLSSSPGSTTSSSTTVRRPLHVDNDAVTATRHARRAQPPRSHLLLCALDAPPARASSPAATSAMSQVQTTFRHVATATSTRSVNFSSFALSRRFSTTTSGGRSASVRKPVTTGCRNSARSSRPSAHSSPS